MELAKNFALFRRTRELESQIDEFLDKLSQSALLFREAVVTYLADGASEEFEERLKHVNDLESKADSLRRLVETQLYAHILIPESRGDVLGLMENKVSWPPGACPPSPWCRCPAPRPSSAP